MAEIEIEKVFCEYSDGAYYAKGILDKDEFLEALIVELVSSGEDFDLNKFDLGGVAYGRTRYNPDASGEYAYLIMEWGAHGQRGAFDITTHERFKYFTDAAGKFLIGDWDIEEQAGNDKSNDNDRDMSL